MPQRRERNFPQSPAVAWCTKPSRRMIGALVEDLLAESGGASRAAGVATLDDVHAAPPLIGFSPAMQAENRELKTFLRENLYRHYQVLRMTNKARRIIGELFAAFTGEPRLLPPQYQQMARWRGAIRQHAPPRPMSAPVPWPTTSPA